MAIDKSLFLQDLLLLVVGVILQALITYWPQVIKWVRSLRRRHHRRSRVKPFVRQRESNLLAPTCVSPPDWVQVPRRKGIRPFQQSAAKSQPCIAEGVSPQ
jgi:hypothetical protein